MYKMYMSVIIGAVLFAVMVRVHADDQYSKPVFNPDTLVRGLLGKDIAAADRERVMRDLVKCGDAAVKGLASFCVQDEISTGQLKILTQALGRIGTEKAAKALIGILALKKPGAESALAALALIKLAVAEDAIIAYKPIGRYQYLAQIYALEKVGTPAALQLLGQHLLASDKVVSTRAYQVLMRLSHCRESETIVDLLDGLIEKIKWLDNEENIPPKHAIVNILRLSVVLNTEQSTELFAGCLDADQKYIVNAALYVLSKNYELAKNQRICEALAQAGAGALNKNEWIIVLRLVRKMHLTKLISLASKCLWCHDRQVNILACDVLTSLTGKNLGRNPQRWKKWCKHAGVSK